MDASKRKRLEEAGWKVGSVQDLLGLTDEEAAFVERKVLVTETVRERQQGSRELSSD